MEKKKTKNYIKLISILYAFSTILSFIFLIYGKLDAGSNLAMVFIVLNAILFPMTIIGLEVSYHSYKDDKYYLDSSTPSYLMIFYLIATVMCVGVISIEGNLDGMFFLPLFFAIGAILGVLTSRNQFLEKHYFLDKPIIGLPFILLIVCFGLGMIYQTSATYQNHCKTRKNENLTLSQDALNAQIHIVDYDKEYDYYGTGCSGIIVKKDRNKYFVLTASHCIPDKSRIYYIITNDQKRYETIRKTETIGINEYYSDKPVAKIEKIDRGVDLALISFTYDKDLPVISLADKDPKYKTPIISVGNPDDEKNYTTYGSVNSRGYVPFHSDVSKSNKVFTHNAYIKNGSSGGAVLNSNMELVGISIGSGSNIFKHFRFACAVPISVVKSFIK